MHMIYGLEKWVDSRGNVSRFNHEGQLKGLTMCPSSEGYHRNFVRVLSKLNGNDLKLMEIMGHKLRLQQGS